MLHSAYKIDDIFKQEQIRIKKWCLSDNAGVKKYININISIKLYSFVCYSPRDVTRVI